MSQDQMYRCVLTGANGGIGSQVAAALAPRCTSMLLVGHEDSALSAIQQQLQSAHPQLRVERLAADLSSAEGRAFVVQQAQQLPDGINLLINNAGILDFHEYASQQERLIEATIGINLLAPMMLTHSLLPMLREAGSAQVVSIGSVFGELGYPGFAAYCASKFGLHGFSQALRRECLGTGVRVRYFAPRATQTGINSSAVNQMNQELGTNMDEPSLVAQRFVQFLAGDQAEMLLGWPEKFYVFLNKLRYQITDGAIGKQLPVIKKYLPTT